MSGATERMPAPQRDEIAQKAVWWTSATVDARLRGTFSADDVYAASVALTALAPDPDCAPEADETACRLMLAAIRASGGDLARLVLWIEAGRLDPRDLIAAAEYRRELTGHGETGRTEDLADYLAWVSGGGA